jgi:hypothetical protein
MMLSAVIDTEALLRVIVAAIGFGVGVTIAFSLSIVGAVRFSELRRDGRMVAAGLAGALAVSTTLVSLGAIVLGIIVMTSK